jgi:hypothetical protein
MASVAASTRIRICSLVRISADSARLKSSLIWVSAMTVGPPFGLNLLYATNLPNALSIGLKSPALASSCVRVVAAGHSSATFLGKAKVATARIKMTRRNLVMGYNPPIGSSRPTVSERSHSCLGRALPFVAVH